MSHHESADDKSHLNPPSICVIAGCTGGAVTSRWIVLGSGEDRQIEVCWKHAEGDLDLESITPVAG